MSEPIEQTPQGQTGQTQTMERPEAFPEAHWNAESGAPNWETFIPHYGELNEAAAAAASRAAALPADAAGYKIGLPEGFKPPEGVPETAQFTIPEDSTLAQALGPWAHQHGVSQQAVSELVGIYAQDVLADANNSLNAAREALGPRADARISAVEQWLGAQGLSDEQFNAIASVTTSAAAVEALEAIINRSSARFSQGTGQGGGDIPRSREEAMKLMNDPSYEHPGSDVRRRVTAFYQRQSGNPHI